MRQTFGRQFAATLLVAFVIAVPATASASFLEVWARGHGSYVGSPTELRHFEQNDKGLAYGFALGAEVLQIDVLMDVNFDPDGSMWNQLGVGFDIDLIPVDGFSLEPKAQALYFFAPHEDSEADSDQGLHARAGVAGAVELFPFFWLGAEGFGGYVYALPENESGMVYSAAVFLEFRFNPL